MKLYRMTKLLFTYVACVIFLVLFYNKATYYRTITKIQNSYRKNELLVCRSSVQHLGITQNTFFFQLCHIFLKNNVKDEAIIIGSLKKWNSLLGEYVFSNGRKPMQEISNGLDYSGLVNNSHGQDIWNQYLTTVNTLFYTVRHPFRHTSNTSYDALEHVIGVCMRLNITCMMLYGTALGSWRHHSIIPWDTDVDVGVIPINNTLLSLTKDLMKAQFQISNKYEFESDKKMRYFARVSGQHETCIFCFSRVVDLYFLTVNSTHVTEEVVSKSHDINDILPTKLRPLGNLLIPSPKHTYRYLKQVYPVHGWKDCDWLKCRDIKEDCGFVYRVPILNHTIEVVIKNLTILHVSVTNDNIYSPPFQINNPEADSRRQVANIADAAFLKIFKARYLVQ